MEFQFSWYLYTPLLSAAVSLLIAGVGVYYRDCTGSRSLVFLMVAIAWWSVMSVIELGATDLATKRLALKLMYPAIGAVPVAWLLFAIQYTGQTRLPTRKELAGILLGPVLMILLVWTNQYHGWFWSSMELAFQGSLLVSVTERGPAFWAWTAYAYVVMAVGTGLMLKLALFSGRVYRTQAIGLSLAALLPWGGNILYLTGVSSVFDLTKIGFVFSGVLLGGAVFRRQLLQVIPAAREIARDEIVASMKEAVIVVDERDVVIDLNPQAKAIIGTPGAAWIGRPLEDVLPGLIELRDSPTDDIPDRAEITVPVNGEERAYEVRQTPLHRGYGTVTGQLITLTDVTERKQREQRIERQRQRLEVVNRVLRHDIRNDMQVILGTTENLLKSQQAQPQLKRIKRKGEDIVTLSERARDLERFVGDGAVETTTVDLSAVVADVIADLERTYPDVEFRVERPDRAEVSAVDLIDSALRNVLENAAEHNDQSVPEVSVTVMGPTDDGDVTVAVADNGPGLPDREQEVIETGTEMALKHSNGLGLWIAYWTITTSGGTITFAENTPRGSVITIRLPSASAEQPKP
ncbi:putative PAS/PAC sensing his kinase [Haloarcula marismortui ATCC 43049]|uniref:histidine kinase n=1 Tax=Haloarcula marismortui (strain ATCC 43049 / DSM 3752 / JCM 8966 / VKM B-1809) TaxID=272569 RepID=Q5V3X6_HALMA|nr:histidine kinase N-terminal 7TM domain-containing protein [Haloarcula marismortui]AAV45776.1 putative PAS/PAC sensing his kinase [Haloarcula marismortui ATCC 43049]QCP90551.1 PAS domain S-box protein [Haloarcula marismortui ATCC 43049]